MPSLNDSFETFIKNLNLSEKVEAEILTAKTDIQNFLRRGLEDYSMTPQGLGKTVTPRFFVQGSWAYKLVNAPEQIPPQHVDYDLGVYLPLSYLEGPPSSVVAGQFFNKVDTLMDEFCQPRGWTVDRSKQTCTRVVLNGTAHFDLPLYSIPDSDFQGLAKAAARKGYIREASAFNDQVVLDHMDIWEELASEHVMLAMRNGTWKSSDPRKVHNWFRDAVARQGEQLRLVCRILKAWRDRVWQKGGPSSIFLMALGAQVFKAQRGRLDLALLEVLRAIPAALAQPVLNPSDRSEDLSTQQKREDLTLLAQQAFAFATDLEAAIWASTGDAANRQVLVRHLGLRFPATDPSDNSGRKLSPEEKAARAKEHDQIHRVGSPWYEG